MKKVIVKAPFRDINDFSKSYAVGDVIETDDARAARLVELGLADGEKAAVKEPEKAAATPDLEMLTPTGEPTPNKRKRKE